MNFNIRAQPSLARLYVSDFKPAIRAHIMTIFLFLTVHDMLEARTFFFDKFPLEKRDNEILNFAADELTSGTNQITCIRFRHVVFGQIHSTYFPVRRQLSERLLRSATCEAVNVSSPRREMTFDYRKFKRFTIFVSYVASFVVISHFIRSNSKRESAPKTPMECC